MQIECVAGLAKLLYFIGKTISYNRYFSKQNIYKCFNKRKKLQAF